MPVRPDRRTMECKRKTVREDVKQTPKPFVAPNSRAPSLGRSTIASQACLNDPSLSRIDPGVLPDSVVPRGLLSQYRIFVWHLSDHAQFDDVPPRDRPALRYVTLLPLVWASSEELSCSTNYPYRIVPQGEGPARQYRGLRGL